jgi:hypothetical protein
MMDLKAEPQTAGRTMTATYGPVALRGRPGEVFQQAEIGLGHFEPDEKVSSHFRLQRINDFNTPGP